MNTIDTTDTMSRVRNFSGRAVTFRADSKNAGPVMVRRDDDAWQLHPNGQVTLGLHGEPYIGVHSHVPATVHYEVRG